MLENKKKSCNFALLVQIIPKAYGRGDADRLPDIRRERRILSLHLGLDGAAGLVKESRMEQGKCMANTDVLGQES